MPFARYGIFAAALAAMIGSVVPAEEPAKTAKVQSTRMPGLPRIAYRSFWPQERYNRQFAEAGVRLVFVYPSNTICSLDVPYSNYPQIWTGPDQYHWKSLDDHVGDVLKWNPQAKLMVMIDLNTPGWWVKSHDGADSFRQLAETVLRDDFQRDAKEYMRRFLQHTESKHRDKIVAYQLSCGGTCEWYDMFGGWFDDPVIMANMKRMTAISERFAETGPGKAEVAVLADADSMYYVDGHCRLADSLLRELQFAMFRAGVPWRCYSLADLPKLDASPYKVVILPNLFVVTPEKRKLLEEKLFRDGKTIVMPFAPGIITDGVYDPANIEKLTGVSVDGVGRPSQPQKAIYRDRGQWTSVFLTRPNMTPSLLREIFRKAGVHVYCEDGDPFYANDELIALHSGKGGKRTFRLPEARKVTELFDDRTVSDVPVAEFTETFEPMETRLYWLEGD